MRKGSNFIGTEEELLTLMKDSLQHYVDDSEWFYNINESTSLSEQEIININEAFAECIDRGYLNDAAYHVLMNKRIFPYAKTVNVIIHSEGISDKELEELYESQPHNAFTLTESGKDFLKS